MKKQSLGETLGGSTSRRSMERYERAHRRLDFLNLITESVLNEGYCRITDTSIDRFDDEPWGEKELFTHVALMTAGHRGLQCPVRMVDQIKELCVQREWEFQRDQHGLEFQVIAPVRDWPCLLCDAQRKVFVWDNGTLHDRIEFKRVGEFDPAGLLTTRFCPQCDHTGSVKSRVKPRRSLISEQPAEYRQWAWMKRSL